MHYCSYVDLMSIIGSKIKWKHSEKEVHNKMTQSLEQIKLIETSLTLCSLMHSLILPKNKPLQKLMPLKMYKDDLDTYISTFRHLVREANYDHNACGTMHLFAH